MIDLIKLLNMWNTPSWMRCDCCKSSYDEHYMVGAVCKGCHEAPLHQIYPSDETGRETQEGTT